jgi:hypothetical protein
MGILLFVAHVFPVFANGEQESSAPLPEEPAVEQPAPPPVREWTFEDVLEKIWRLAAIQVGYGNIRLDRAAMKTAGMDELYVLQFNEEGVNGKALDNYYFAPYMKREGKEVAFHQIVGTNMADPGTVNAGGLDEEQYYRYLQQVTHWNVADDRLELHTGDGAVTLYYIL